MFLTHEFTHFDQPASPLGIPNATLNGSSMSAAVARFAVIRPLRPIAARAGSLNLSKMTGIGRLSVEAGQGMVHVPLIALAVLFFGIAAGAALQVVVEVGRFIRSTTPGGLLSGPVIGGFVAGIAVMWTTGLLVG